MLIVVSVRGTITGLLVPCYSLLVSNVSSRSQSNLNPLEFRDHTITVQIMRHHDALAELQTKLVAFMVVPYT